MPSDGDDDHPDNERLHREDVEPLDFSPSSGATDPVDARKDTDTEMATGRHDYTANETFTRGELPAQSEQWESLNQANREPIVDDPHVDADGVTDEESRKTRQRRTDARNDTRAWGRQIGLTDAEVDRAVRLVLLAEEGWRNNHGTEAVVLAALTLAANEPTPVPKSIRPSVPVDTDPDLETTYDAIRTTLDVPREEVNSCREHLRTFL